MADAGVGEAAAATAAKGAGEAAAAGGAGALGAGAGAGLAAAGTEAATAGVLGEVGAGLTGVGAGLGATAGPAAMAGLTGEAALGATAAGITGGGLAGAALPGLEGAAAGLGSVGSSLGGGAAASGIGAGGAPSASGGGLGVVPSAADVSGTTAGGNAFIPAVNGTAPLSSDVMSSLGITPTSQFTMPTLDAAGGAASGGVPISEGGGLVGSATSGIPQAAAAAGTAPSGLSISGLGQQALDWIAKNPLKAAQLGLIGKSMLTKPNMPAFGALNANSQQAGAFANPILQNQGALNATQKSAIDDSINQQLQQGIAQIQQNAVNAGQGTDSSIVSQRIQQFKQQLETQREQLYMQAQQQNVNQALSALGISNQGLATVASNQFAQDKQAQAAMNDTASLIGKLNAMGGGGATTGG